MNKYILISLAASAILLSGCKSLEAGGWVMPKPQESKYLKTTAGNFMGTLNSDRKVTVFSCNYGANISPKLPRPSYARVVFEMPGEEKEYKTEMLIGKNDTSISTTSTPSKNWKHYQGYKVKVFVFSDEGMTKQIDYLEQFIRFQRPPAF